MEKLKIKITKDIILLFILIAIDITFLVSFFNGTIILNSTFNIISFILVMGFINGFIGFLTRVIIGGKTPNFLRKLIGAFKNRKK